MSDFLTQQWGFCFSIHSWQGTPYHCVNFLSISHSAAELEMGSRLPSPPGFSRLCFVWIKKKKEKKGQIFSKQDAHVHSLRSCVCVLKMILKTKNLLHNFETLIFVFPFIFPFPPSQHVNKCVTQIDVTLLFTQIVLKGQLRGGMRKEGRQEWLGLFVLF